jgi:hypothetical protein
MIPEPINTSSRVIQDFPVMKVVMDLAQVDVEIVDTGPHSLLTSLASIGLRLKKWWKGSPIGRLLI